LKNFERNRKLSYPKAYIENTSVDIVCYVERNGNSITESIQTIKPYMHSNCKLIYRPSQVKTKFPNEYSTEKFAPPSLIP